MPPRNVARIIADHHLLESLESALDSIFEQFAIENLFALTLDHELTNLQSSRKRKRSSEFKTAVATSQTIRLDQNAVPMLQALLDGLGSCLALAQGDIFDVDTSVQSVRIALRANVELAAALLGHALTAATVMISSEDLLFRDDQMVPNIAILNILPQLWDFRDQQSAEAAGEASNVAFTKKCLVPTLAILKRLQEHTSSATSPMSAVKRLQKMIVLHVVFPLRSTFYAAMATVKQTQSTDQLSSVLTSLQSAFDISSLDKFKTVMFLLPVFLATAVKAVPLNTNRRRQHEIPWLQTLFTGLYNLGGKLSSFSVEDGACQAKQASCLEGLLHVINLYRIPLPLQTLADVASTPSSGLLHQNSAPKWTLLAHIARLDINVFLPSAGSEKISRLSDALIAALSSQKSCDSLAKIDIAILLIEGFGRARDMSTFLELMRKELTSNFEISPRGSVETPGGTRKPTIWEDRAVLSFLNSTLKAVLTPSLIDDEFSRYLNNFEVYTSAQDKSRLYASTVVLDALLMTKSDLFHLTSRESILAEKIPSAISNVLTENPSEFSWQEPFWSLLWHVALIVDQHGHKLQSPAWEVINSKALNIASNNLSSEQVQTREILRVAANAFRLFVLLTKSNVNVDHLQQALSSLSQSLLKLSNQNGLVHADKAPWNGVTIFNVRDNLDLTVTCTAALLLFPETLLHVSQQCLLFFQALLQCADLERQPFESYIVVGSTPFTKLFQGFVTHKTILSERELLGQIFEAILARVESSNIQTDFVVKILSELPLDYLSRRRRARLCDSVFNDCNREEIKLRDQLVQRLSVRLDLLTILVITADNSASVLDDPEALWDIVSKCSSTVCNSSTGEELLTSQCRELFEIVWKRTLASPERRRKFTSASLRILSSFLAEPATRNLRHSLPCWDYHGSLIKLLRSRHDLVSETGIEEQIHAIVDRWFVHLNEKLGSLATRAQNPDEMSNVYRPFLWTLDALSTIEERCATDQLLNKSLLDMEQSITNALSSQSIAQKLLIAIESFRCHLQTQSKAWKLEGDGAKLSSIRESLKMVLNLESINCDSKSSSRKGLRHQAKTIRRAISSLSQAELPLYFRVLDEYAKRYQNVDPEKLVTMVVAAVSALDQSPSRQKPEAHHLIAVIATLQDTLSVSMTLDSFVLTCDCIIYLLKTQPHLVTQFVFDNTLGAIALCTSTAGPRSTLSGFGSSIIYSRLTTLATVLILHYRKRLGGRFHLLLPVLQNLLRCLFISHNPSPGSKTSSQDRIQQPPWLMSSKLLPHAATSLTRLLTTITHPTPSSLSAHHSLSYDTLTDPVPRARRTASQYLQYVLIEYCACRLQARLEPEVKTALGPGLFAILEVMDDDMHKGMNGLMNRQSRDVFRGLWAEWGVSRGRFPGNT